MSACIFFATIVAFFQIKWMFKTVNDLRFDEPSDVQKLRHEISIWHRSATSLSPYSKVERLQVQLEKKLKSGEVATESYIATLEELEKKYPIKNKMLLFKSCIALIFVITFFFLHSVPNLQKLSLGWTALLGAVLLLILYDREDMEAILHHVEWATLLFFAALFVLMEALAELGLIEWIGKQTVSMILSVGEGARLAVAILIILWVINRISCGKIINFCFFL
jgi:P protein